MKFYFTFGSDTRYPYGRDDFVLVVGTDRNDCIRAFREKHPDRDDSGIVNCAFIYKEEKWKDLQEKFYKGQDPVEIIISENAYGRKPEGFGPIWLLLPEKKELLFIRRKETRTRVNPSDVQYARYAFEYIDPTKESKFITEKETGILTLEYYIMEHYICLADAIPDILDRIYNDRATAAQIMELAQN